MVNKKFWAATFTLSGTIIGAGILGLPYIFSKSGFFVGVLWLIIFGGIMTFVNLCFGEITLRTNGKHQLSGYAEKYLGKWGKRIMFFAVIFGVYSALLAYIVGEGKSLSQILPWDIDPIFYGIIFWGFLTFLLKGGMRELKKIETYSVLTIIFIILGILLWFLPTINFENLLLFDLSKFFIPIGVILFSLLGFIAIPELKNELKGQEKLLKKAIILGGTIPVFLYIIFCGIFIGILGNNISEVATLSLGPIVTMVGIFTMSSAFFILTYSLKNTFKFDFGVSEKTNLFFSSLLPLIVYLLIQKFNLLGFTSILGIGGVVSAGLTGIMILIMEQKAKKYGNREPEFKMPIGWVGAALLSLIFAIGIFFECLK
ncbi:MAG: aromatic amino acid transport family protein [Candidatus Pacearchaeota archaeon]